MKKFNFDDLSAKIVCLGFLWSRFANSMFCLHFFNDYIKNTTTCDYWNMKFVFEYSKASALFLWLCTFAAVVIMFETLTSLRLDLTMKLKE